jgi:hypothetical protein
MAGASAVGRNSLGLTIAETKDGVVGRRTTAAAYRP